MILDDTLSPCQLELLSSAHFDDYYNGTISYDCKHENIQLKIINEGKLSEEELNKIVQSMLKYCEGHCTRTSVAYRNLGNDISSL